MSIRRKIGDVVSLADDDGSMYQMTKNKPRWEPVSAYELAKKKASGQATEAEIKAADQARDLRLSGVRPQICNVNGRLVVR